MSCKSIIEGKYNMFDIVISVVCYDNEKEILEFADKLGQQSAKDRLVLVVTCNKCLNCDKLKSELKKSSIKTKVYDAGGNLGYLCGCLYGLVKLNEEYKWAVISNTDVDFGSNDFFDIFYNTSYGEKVACVGPNIVLKKTGKKQNPFAKTRPTYKQMKIRQIAYSNYILFKLYFGVSILKNRLKDMEAVLQPRENVYGVHGSFVFLKKECIDFFIKDKIRIFMYGEELYIAEKLRSKQLLAVYDSNLKIIHNENQTTGKETSNKKQKWFRQSINYIMESFFT